MQHLLKEEDKRSQGATPTAEEVLELRADIAELKQCYDNHIRFPKTCQVDEESNTIQELYAVEKILHNLINTNLQALEKEGTKERQQKIEEILGLITVLNRYREAKTSIELLKHLHYPTKPI